MGNMDDIIPGMPVDVVERSWEFYEGSFSHPALRPVEVKLPEVKGRNHHG